MDVLSDVLHTVRLSGSVFFTAEMTAPWSVTSPPGEQLAQALMPSAEWFVLFHVIARGECTIELPGGTCERFGEGDVAIFPHGESHLMGDCTAVSSSPVPVASLVNADDIPGPFRVDHGGGGEPTELVCGFLGGTERFDPLVRALPTILCVRTSGRAVVIDACPRTPGFGYGPGLRFEGGSPTGEWLATSMRYVAHEAREARAGGQSMLSRLAETLFLQVLRHFVEQSAPREGWLSGLRDPRLGRALGLLHDRPDHPWTVTELARSVGMSRSALGSRFARVVGEPPMRYLARWRMHLARKLMRDPRLSLAEVGDRVGYGSEAAFHRAFKRHAGEPPGAWRDRKLAASDASRSVEP